MIDNKPVSEYRINKLQQVEYFRYLDSVMWKGEWDRNLLRIHAKGEESNHQKGSK